VSKETFRYSEHMEYVLEVLRPELRREWVTQTIEEPEWQAEQEPSIVRYFRRIEAFGGRVLRVVVNYNESPPLIVTAFFDRRAKP